MAEAVATASGESARQSLQAAVESLDGIARSEIAAALLGTATAEEAAENTTVEAKSMPPQLAAALGLEGVSPADDARHTSELMTLPAGFSTQAAAMPLYLRKLLVENAPPTSACIGSVLRARAYCIRSRASRIGEGSAKHRQRAHIQFLLLGCLCTQVLCSLESLERVRGAAAATRRARCRVCVTGSSAP